MIYGSQIFTFITWSPSKSSMSYPNWLVYGLTIKRKSITGTKIKSLSKFWSSHFSNIFFNIFILYILYSQATHITFICPMLFDSFPLDTQVCKFQVSNQLRPACYLCFLSSLNKGFWKVLNTYSSVENLK